MPIDLETYRDELEDMTAEALTEYYEHSAGLKPTMEMARIYDRYGHLTTLESSRELAAILTEERSHRDALQEGLNRLVTRGASCGTEPSAAAAPTANGT